MQHYNIPSTDLSISRIALGCMTLAGSWDPNVPVDAETTAKARRIVEAALDLDINFFDHADIYCSGRSETAFGNVLKESPALRDRMVLHTKCGIRFRGVPGASDPPRFDFRHDHIVWSVEQSLKRLATDRIDILLLHRPDPLANPAEVAKAFDAVHKAGKVRYFGVSNHSASQMELLRRSLGRPLVANQVQLSLIHNNLINEAVGVNQSAASYTGSDGLLDYCRFNSILVQAWSPTAHGRLAHPRPDGNDSEMRIAAEVARVAQALEVPTDAVVLAWLLRHPAGIQPIVGTTNLQHLKDNVQADRVELTHTQWWQLFVASRGGWLP